MARRLSSSPKGRRENFFTDCPALIAKTMQGMYISPTALRGNYPLQRRLGAIRQPDYQTRQDFSGLMGWPLAHSNALPNSSKFWTVPLTRHRPGECGSAETDCRAENEV